MRDQLQTALGAQYTLERELGRGGMATVFLAQDTKHHRSVALKVLHPELAATLGPQRFRREIEVAARLQHPHILSVHDSGETPAGQLWFTMPYVEGESLRDRLRRERQLPVDDALRITREVASALEYAHEHGVLHRDIKPENVLLTAQGEALLADFGIARALTSTPVGTGLTETGLAVGTPQYMSPEQAAGERTLDARSDVYALGAVCYELLTGEPPFVGGSAQAVVAKMLSTDAPSVRVLRPGVIPALDAALRRALARVPADRWATAAEFAQALATAERIGCDRVRSRHWPSRAHGRRPPGPRFSRGHRRALRLATARERCSYHRPRGTRRPSLRQRRRHRERLLRRRHHGRDPEQALRAACAPVDCVREFQSVPAHEQTAGAGGTRARRALSVDRPRSVGARGQRNASRARES